MTTGLADLAEAVESMLASSGFYERITRHEPKSAPGQGITAAVWLARDKAVAAASGLAATSVRVELFARFYKPFLSEPEDRIDIEMYAAVDDFRRTISAHFTLGGLVRNIDLLGAHGEPPDMNTTYLRQDGTVYRIADVTVPLIVNDMWPQVA